MDEKEKLRVIRGLMRRTRSRDIGIRLASVLVRLGFVNAGNRWLDRLEQSLRDDEAIFEGVFPQNRQRIEL